MRGLAKDRDCEELRKEDPPDLDPEDNANASGLLAKIRAAVPALIENDFIALKWD